MEVVSKIASVADRMEVGVHTGAEEKNTPPYSTGNPASGAGVVRLRVTSQSTPPSRSPYCVGRTEGVDES